jgi:hypothetical protein
LARQLGANGIALTNKNNIGQIGLMGGKCPRNNAGITAFT